MLDKFFHKLFGKCLRTLRMKLADGRNEGCLGGGVGWDD